ncbi:MAG: tetratricopeptide repeat protein [Fidelibacterota bacterium]
MAQNADIDSLRHALASAETDSARVAILIKLGTNVDDYDLDKAIDYSLQALELMPATAVTLQRGILLNDIGYNFWRLGKFYEAVDYYKKALVIFEDLKDDRRIARVCNNIGAVYWGISNYNEALDMYQRAFNLRKNDDNIRGISLTINNIGLIYQEWGLYDKALEYHRQALEYAIQSQSDFEQAYSYINLGACYEAAGDFESASKYYQLSYDRYQVSDQIGALSLVTKEMGDLYFRMEQFPAALRHYRQSLQLAAQKDNRFRSAIAEFKLGETYLETGKIDSARQYVLRSLAKAEQNGYNDLIRDTHFMLAEIAEKEGNILQALDYFKTASAVKDSIFNKEKISKFTELQIRYHDEQQSRENALLRKNNEIYRLKIKQQRQVRNALVIGGAFILIILGLIYYSRTSFKKMIVLLRKQNTDIMQINSEKEKLIEDLTHEIIERKAVEKKLRESEAKYRMMVEGSRDAVVIYQHEKLVYFNHAFAAMLGYTESEISATRASELFTPDSSRELDEIYQKWHDGESVPGRFEMEFRRKNGTGLYAEANVSVLDYQGQKAVFAIIRDITRQKEILQALENSTEQAKGLKGFIPICAGCNKIRDDELPGKPWVSPAEYISKRLPKIKFSHGMCPDCMEKWDPDFNNKKSGK